MDRLLLNASSELGIDLTSSNLEHFLFYKDFLLNFNKRVNLTAISDERDVIIKHFIDSLSVFFIMDFEEGASIIDIGTGAGFPGVPIKIYRPDLKLTLVDSLNKRITFLNELISNLKLSDVVCLHKRAEDCGRDDTMRESFDYCVSRAVASLNILCEYAIPLIKVGGCFIAYKGPNFEQELELAAGAIDKLGCKLLSIEHLILPKSSIKRNFIVIKKLRPTSLFYPRKQSLIKKNTL